MLSVEAGVTFGWATYADDSIGIDRFGASAPGDLVMEKLGINVDNVVDARHGAPCSTCETSTDPIEQADRLQDLYAE